jgi:hypothetical protein
MELAPSAAIAASVGLRHLMDQWGVWPASPTPLTRFIGLAPLRWMRMGWDGLVTGKIAKGHFVQGCNIQEFSVGDGITFHPCCSIRPPHMQFPVVEAIKCRLQSGGYNDPVPPRQKGLNELCARLQRGLKMEHETLQGGLKMEHETPFCTLFYSVSPQNREY